MLRIQEAREARGWTQEQLANALGTTQQTVQRWESGAVDPKVSKVEAISEALGITISFLLGVDTPHPSPSLTPAESELLALYRSMDGDAKARVMEYAAFQADAHPLNQEVRVAKGA